jgi:hypothetical protein
LWRGRGEGITDIHRAQGLAIAIVLVKGLCPKVLSKIKRKKRKKNVWWWKGGRKKSQLDYLLFIWEVNCLARIPLHKG